MLMVMDNGYADLPPGQAEPPAGHERTSARGAGRPDPKIDSAFRTIADADNRAITGLSMGGGQALGIGLEHLDTFRSIGCFSGRCNV